MINFLQAERCREAMLLEYFGENAEDNCGHCDWCLSKSITHKRDISKELLTLLQAKPGISLKEIETILSNASVIDTLRKLLDDGTIIRNANVGFEVYKSS